MPYNTRRVSLSLPSLGIQLPHSSRSAAAHRSPPSLPSADLPPSKRPKRSHTIPASPPPSCSSSTTTTTSTSSSAAALSALNGNGADGSRNNNNNNNNNNIKNNGRKSRDGRAHVATAAAAAAAGRIAQNTPPPSPGDAGGYRIDTEGIKDDVVVAVIDQLDRTGNRPHSAKELASIFVNSLDVVESSANPAAMVSSRLTAYLKRPWSSFAPCPIEKELLETHPRRTYFFLSTYPHQPIPETSSPPVASRIISPSLSSAAGEEEEEEEEGGGGGEGGCGRESRSRAAPSPSPEIDLSAPDLDVEEDVGSPITPGGSFSAHKGSMLRDASASTVNIAHNRRAASPPLERDEREFEQTASSLQKRKHLSQLESVRQDYEDADEADAGNAPAVQPVVEDAEESAVLRSSQAAAELFGQGTGMAFDLSSPVLHPHVQKRYSVGGEDMEGVQLEGVAAETEQEHDGALEASWQWAESRRPELIGVEELDEMFGGY